MATDTTVNNLIINKLTKAQYNAIETKSDTELYLVPDTIDSTPTSGSTNLVESGGVYTALSGKQATLTTQTAYTSKGTATKVPQITTNTLGQVTSITEVTITQPDISGKEDKLVIDSTAKTASFTASVGKYYTVNVANDSSVAVTLPTSGFTTTDIQSIVFLVTLGSGTASCTFSPVAMTAEGTLDASSTYEVNALWNGTGWYVSFVKLVAST